MISLRTPLMLAAAALALGACSDDGSDQARARAQEGLTIGETWCRASPQGATEASCFATVSNNTAQVETLRGGASSAGQVAMHETYVDGNVFKMRAVPGVTIAANSTAQFAPGKYVIRLTDLTAPLVAGSTVPVSLAFEQAGAQQVLFPVRIEADSPS
jgi:periplasmic copper chaperone A